MGKNEEIKKIIKKIEDSKIEGDFIKTQDNLEKILELDSENKEIKNQLSHILFINGEIKKSEILVNELLVTYPKDIELLKLNALINYNYKNYKKAINLYRTILDINDKEIDAYIDITRIYDEIGDYDQVTNYSKKGLKFDKNNISLLNNLAAGLIYKEQFKDAFDCIRRIDDLDPINRISGTIGNFLKEQLNNNYKFKFINSPINYVQEFKISQKEINKSNLFNDPVTYIEKFEPEWEPKDKSTRNGFQTKSNLFSEYKNDIEIKKLTDFIELSITKYLSEYRDSADLYIKKFPNSVLLKGWAVILKESGYQRMHNHPDGWISGVIYIKTPTNLIANQGKIEFSTKGYKFPSINNNFSRTFLSPKKGKLILFPSSLHHRTIPIENEKDRVSISFDIIAN